MKQLVWILIVGVGLATGGMFAVQVIDPLLFLVFLIYAGINTLCGWLLMRAVYRRGNKFHNNIHAAIFLPWLSSIGLRIVLAAIVSLPGPSILLPGQVLLAFASVGGAIAYSRQMKKQDDETLAQEMTIN